MRAISTRSGNALASILISSQTRAATDTSVCAQGSQREPQHVGHWVMGMANSGRTQER